MNERIDSIVAGVADADGYDPRVGPALELTRTVGATLHLVHAIEAPDPVLLPGAAPEDRNAEGLENLRGAMRSRLETARHLSARDRVVCHVLPVAAAEALLDVAQREDADLIMMGATEREWVAGTLLGTTAQRVLRASTVPVLVKRRPNSGKPRRILLTTNLSDLSAGVHERGLALVTSLWGSSDLIVRSLLVAGDDVLLPSPVNQVAMHETAQERLEDFLGRVRSADLNVEGKVRLGLSAREILAEVEEWSADLLVLGTQGRTGTSRFLIGSVAETVLRKAACDTLLIPSAAVISAANHDQP